MALKDTAQIDFIALDPTTQEVVLGIVEPRPWDSSDRRIYELQEKVNAYLSFALDGEMTDHLPQVVGKAIRLQLDCVEAPDERTQHFLDIIKEQISFQGIAFKLHIAPEIASAMSGGCCGGSAGAGGCGCAPHHDHSDHEEHNHASHAHAGHAHDHRGAHAHAHNHASGGCGSGSCGCA